MPAETATSRAPILDSPRSVAVIVNPAAGRGRAARRIAALRESLDRECSAAGASGRMLLTEGPRHAERLARQAVAEGADLVVAAGGDGTVGEVLNGLAGTSARLGLVPLGTGNDLSRHLRVPSDIAGAVRLLFRGEPRRIDLGVVAGRRFANAAGCGFDATVAERVNRGLFLRGTPAYLCAVLQTLATYRATHLRLLVDDACVETPALLCAIANSSSYGGGMRVAPDASVCDGLLDVCIVRDVGRIEFLRNFPRVFRGTHVTHPGVTMLLGARVSVRSDPPAPVLVDGEVIGATPVEVSVEPSALTVMAPAGGAP